MRFFLLLNLFLFATSPDDEKTFLRIHWKSDLQFGVAIQGDPPLTVSPDLSAASGSASVEVRGRPHSTYQLILPQNRISLHNLHCGCGARIGVSEFRSNPPEGMNGKLDGNGRQTVSIGATRESISMHQPRGKYAGSFLVTAIYP